MLIVTNWLGRSFALILQDGSCRVYNVNNGKLMYNVHPPRQDRAWTAITWGQLAMSEEALNSQPFKNIVKLDPLKHIPKLPMLQGSVPESNTYIQRQFLDDILHNNLKDPQTFSMGLIFVGSRDGIISLSAFGTFSIGEIQLPQRPEVLSISSMKNQTRHMVLTRDETGLSLVPLSVDFIHKYGLYLMDVTVIPVKLLAVLEYIKDTLALVQGEMKVMSEANREFLTSLSGVIEMDKTDTDPKFPGYNPPTMPKTQLIALRAESALLDALLTGIANDSIEYWLKDILKEKGIKKWRKLCFNSYDNIRKFLFENLLPACERTLLLLTELRGLAKWAERGIPLGLDPELLDTCVEKVVAMASIANNLIWSLNSQFQLYRFFSSWIEIQFEEVTGIPIKDPAADANGPKYTVSSKVVEYITKHIGASMNLEEDEGQQIPSKNLSSTYASVEESCKQVLEKIKARMLQQVYASQGLPLAAHKDAEARVQLVETPNQDTFCYVAICEGTTNLTFARFKLSGSDPVTAVEIARVDVRPGPGYKSVQQAEFINDEAALFLVTDEEESKKMMIKISFSSLLYAVVAYEPGKSLVDLAAEVAQTPLEIIKAREFTEEFIPSHFSVNDARHVGCLLERDNQQFMLVDTNELTDGEEDELEE